MGSAVPSSKDDWRTQFRMYRCGLSALAYRARSALLVHRALAHRALAAASVVHAYWPQVEAREVDTRLLIAALRIRDVSVALPVVTSYAPEAPSMEFRTYEGRGALTPNRWGIPEPVDGTAVPPEAIEVVLVPALGADRAGNRIGQGAGYYDAFLASVSAPRVGLVYDACVVPSVPAEVHDVPLTTLVTERKTISGRETDAV